MTILLAVATTPSYAQPSPSLRILAGGEEVCLTAPREERRETAFAGAAVALGSAIVRSGTSALGRYFANLAQSTSSSLLTALGDTDLYLYERASDMSPGRIAPNFRCLVVAVGYIGRLDPNRYPKFFYEQDWRNLYDPDALFVKVLPDGRPQPTVLHRLGFVDLPTAYFEFRVEPHPIAEAFKLRRVTTYFRESLALRNRQEPKNIEITITMARPTLTGSFEPSRAGQGGTLVAQIPLVIRHLRPDPRMPPGEATFETLWIAQPRSPATNPDSLNSLREQLNRSGDRTVTFEPVNIFATYREVDAPDLMFHFLANVLTESSAQVSDLAEQLIKSLNERAQSKSP